MFRKCSLIGTIIVGVMAGAPAVADDATTIGGFVDASWYGEVETQYETFGLDQVEVDIERTIGEDGYLRADVEWAKNGDDWDVVAEQGFLTWYPPFAPKLAASLGKFNAAGRKKVLQEDVQLLREIIAQMK